MQNNNNAPINLPPEPPNSTEAEEAVLGSVMINPDSFAMVSGFLSPQDFYIVRNGWVWEAMIALDARGDDIDNITVVHELRDMGKLELVGNSAYITSLINNTPTHVHAETYARLVENTAIMRRMLKATSEIATMVYAGGMALPDMIQKGHDILTEATKIKSDGDFKFLDEFASENYDRIEKIYNNRGELLGIPTGLTALDAALEGNGFQPAKVYCVAARPGMGKSALAGGFAVAAAKHGKHVLIISREMTGNDMHFRMVAGETSVNAKTIKSGDANDDDLALFMEGIGRTSKYPIAIDDRGDGTIGQLKPKIKRLHREWGIDMIIVDYLQLLDADEKKGQTREREVATISRFFKRIAMSLRIPVISLSQLNRDVEDRKDKHPNLSDLRDSGAIEQDSDVVLFIYRDDYYDEQSIRPRQADLILAKQRDGESSPVPIVVGWISTLTKFVDHIPDQAAIDLVESWNS